MNVFDSVGTSTQNIKIEKKQNKSKQHESVFGGNPNDIQPEVAAQIVKNYIIPMMQSTPSFNFKKNSNNNKTMLNELIWLSQLKDELVQTRE